MKSVIFQKACHPWFLSSNITQNSPVFFFTDARRTREIRYFLVGEFSIKGNGGVCYRFCTALFANVHHFLKETQEQFFVCASPGVQRLTCLIAINKVLKTKDNVGLFTGKGVGFARFNTSGPSGHGFTFFHHGYIASSICPKFSNKEIAPKAPAK